MSDDNKSNDNKDGSFDLLVHEKKISELYQKNKQHLGEEPSSKIDIKIMAMAKQQISEPPSVLIKEQTFNQPPPANQNTQPKTRKAWQWPFSLVASMGFLGVLLITQQEYFIHPNNIVATDAGMLNEALMQATDINADEAAVKFFQREQTVSTAQKYEVLLDPKISAVTRKRISVNQTEKVLNEQMLHKPTLADNAPNTPSMSLVEMTRLAELLKLELSLQNKSGEEMSVSKVNMQQTLFEQLSQYQKSHEEFTITEKYLSVLTDKQVQQLIPIIIEAVPEN